MLAGGIVEPGAGAAGAVVAFVAVSGFPSGSRLFRVEGPASAPAVREIEAATTIDLGRFDREAAEELAPALAEIAARGGVGAIARPAPAWVAAQVRAHLERTEGLHVD